MASIDSLTAPVNPICRPDPGCHAGTDCEIGAAGTNPGGGRAGRCTVADADGRGAGGGCAPPPVARAVDGAGDVRDAAAGVALVLLGAAAGGVMAAVVGGAGCGAGTAAAAAAAAAICAFVSSANAVAASVRSFRSARPDSPGSDSSLVTASKRRLAAAASPFCIS